MTNSVGITVRTTTKRPHLRGVVLDDAGMLLRTFEHRCSSAQDHEMLHAIGQALAAELAAQPVIAVLVREAGYARGTGLTSATKNRLRGEGVVLSIARGVTSTVTVADGQGVARLLGVPLADADKLGAKLASGEHAEAASAALAAMKLASGLD